MSEDDPARKSKLQVFADLATICAFLGFAERDNPTLTYGGHTISEVIDAWCQVSGLPREKITQVMNAVPESELQEH